MKKDTLAGIDTLAILILALAALVSLAVFMAYLVMTLGWSDGLAAIVVLLAALWVIGRIVAVAIDAFLHGR